MVQFLLCLKTFVFQSNIVIITLMFVFAYFLQKIGTGRTRGLGALAGTDEIRTMARSFFLLRVPDLCHTQTYQTRHVISQKQQRGLCCAVSVQWRRSNTIQDD